jgi:hypothetical protein
MNIEPMDHLDEQRGRAKGHKNSRSERKWNELKARNGLSSGKTSQYGIFWRVYEP